MGKKGKSRGEAAKRTDWGTVKKPKKTAFFRKLTLEEKKAVAQWILDHPENPKRGSTKPGKGLTELDRLDSGEMVFDVFRCETPGVPTEEAIMGEAVGGEPLEMDMILDFTGLRGSGGNIYHSLIYQLPKWSYWVKKVDESLQVSPVYADLYNVIVGQKQKIEASIKTGLTSAAQAVADYELLSHDARRYGEILDYFKEGQTDEHVLRSLFVDRVDAFTGEGYSLITMAKRWPTIITDFIRMGSPEFKKQGWGETKDIHTELDVSMAEATVLKTKDRLFKEWKATFFPAVKTRYARIQALLQARKKSVEEYRNWLKPYIAKYRVMKEADEDNPAQWVSDAYTTPGFGQSEAMVKTRLWVWKVFRVWEMGKPSSYKEKKQKDWVLNPYDDFVRRWKKRIEYKYEVKIEDKDVEAVLEEARKFHPGIEFRQMEPDFLYYIVFDMKILLSLLRTPPPEGMETDNMMFYPLVTYYISQNVMLLMLLEMKARESQMVHYIDELIGASNLEEDIFRHVEEEFEGKEEKKGALKRTKERLHDFKVWATRHSSITMRIAHLFVRPGPYESIFYERVSKTYSRAVGAYYGQITGFIKDKMHVGN